MDVETFGNHHLLLHFVPQLQLLYYQCYLVVVPHLLHLLVGLHLLLDKSPTWTVLNLILLLNLQWLYRCYLVIEVVRFQKG